MASRRRQKSPQGRRRRASARRFLSGRSARTTAGICACRRCTRSTTRRAATPTASRWCSCTAGPAAAPIPKMRRFFDPKRYRIVLFDQRGCGKSRPHASLERQHHLAPGRRHRSAARASRDRQAGRCSAARGARRSRSPTRRSIPSACTELVLRGIFLLRRWELEWFYQDPGGAAALFPDLWEHYLAPLSAEERKDCMRAYYRRLTSDDRKTLLEAARAWSIWEGALSYIKHEPGLREASSATRNSPRRSRASSATTS